MKISTVLTKDPWDPPLPPEIFTVQRRRSHRPKASFRIRIQNEADVAAARKVGLPLHLLGPEVTAAWGFPQVPGYILVVARELATLVDTDFPSVILESAEAARSPRLEDLVIVLLRKDPLLARALARRHQRFLSPERMLKRLLQENLEEVATKVNLQSIFPGLPRVGFSIPEDQLIRQDSNAWVEGRL